MPAAVDPVTGYRRYTDEPLRSGDGWRRIGYGWKPAWLTPSANFSASTP